MLEVWDEQVDPFAAVRGYLESEGFFGRPRDDAVADVFFAYRISDRLRRAPRPAPPEPCVLPLAACRIASPGASTGAGSYSLGDWKRSWSADDHARAVGAVRQAIARGDVYQVNLVQHLSAPFDGDPRGIARALAPLAPLHPEPLAGEGWAVVSASPELFLARRGDRLVTMPIKGTRPLTDDGLLESDKDAAEHVMIVDLERNDLSRVCDPGTVRWPELMVERRLAGVAHLVSTVTGRLRPDATFEEILWATFPGGSITGAPKISALDHIAGIEPVGRGASMGAIGRIHPDGDFELALTIRTFAVSDGRIHLWVGGGIVWDSDPEEEIEESWVKARPLLRAVASRAREPVRA